MKLIQFGPVSLGKMSMQNGFEKMFGPETLFKVHGNDAKATPWNDNKRIVKFHVKMDDVPKELKRVMVRSRFQVTSKQEMETHETEINVRNSLKLHFIGAELFKIKPSFYLVEKEGHLFAGGNVEHHAILPPPLNKIAEAFMCRHSQKELELYESIIRSDGSQ